jgi:hypothetical protein
VSKDKKTAAVPFLELVIKDKYTFVGMTEVMKHFCIFILLVLRNDNFFRQRQS